MSMLSIQDVRAAIAAGALIILAAGCATAGPTPASSPTPALSPTPVPVAASPWSVVSLANATRSDIVVEIQAPGGLVVSAASGEPGDGASVEPYRLQVVNDDPSTLRLTWTGGPCDARDTLTIDPSIGQLLLVQPACPGDAVVFDRVLVLQLATPLDGGALQAIVQDGLDTAE